MSGKVKILLGVCVLVLAVAAAVLFLSRSPAEYRKITAEEAKEMLDSNPEIILLDVRTEAEYVEQHIPGAVLSSDADISDKNAVILVYCRTGRRSETASRELVGMGYTNVYDFGGIVDWPYEIE